MKTAFLILFGIIAIAYIGGMFGTQKIRTQIDINSTPEVVWEQLAKFEKHSEWNPFIKKIAGDLSVGSQLAVTIKPPGGKSMDFKPTLLTVNRNKELRWIGQLLIPKLFDGEHYFIINDNADGTVRLIHGEEFTGILALILWGTMEQDTRNGFEAMNEAIKIRSESA